MEDNTASRYKMNENDFNTSLNEQNSLKHKHSPKKSITHLSSDLSFEFLKKSIRVRYGSLADCARAINMNRSELSQILSGAYIPQSIKVIQKLADALNINPIILTQFFCNALKNKTDFNIKKITK